MKYLVVLLAAVVCHAAPQIPYNVVQAAPIVVHGQSLSPAVMKIPKPGIRFGVPQPVRYTAPVVVSAPAPVPVVTPVQYNVPAAVVAPAIPALPTLKVAPAIQAAPAVVPAVYAAAPEPLQAPDPPMPSIGTPYTGGQFHAQDERRQYTFGHWGGPNTRVETRDSYGRTSGSFAYVDPIGDVQVRKYAAAPATGFRVAASDLP
ncbi:hypothetical protein SK128_008557 [Halocaridina rubra]|uniref:Cuticle protein n=1 Tax=Halocaridina rubra TaxID=373956 RepID=A0AAN8XSQ3_HALRR